MIVEYHPRPLPPTVLPEDFDDREPLRRTYLRRLRSAEAAQVLEIFLQGARAHYEEAAVRVEPGSPPLVVEMMRAGRAELGMLVGWFAGMAQRAETPWGRMAAEAAANLEAIGLALGEVMAEPPPESTDRQGEPGPLRETWVNVASSEEAFELFRAALAGAGERLGEGPQSVHEAQAERPQEMLRAGLEDLHFLELWFATVGALRGDIELDQNAQYLAEVATETEHYLRQAGAELTAALEEDGRSRSRGRGSL